MIAFYHHQNTNQFLVYVKIELQVFYTTIINFTNWTNWNPHIWQVTLDVFLNESIIICVILWAINITMSLMCLMHT